MRIVSVNVGMAREVLWEEKTVRTGIFKVPVEGAVMVGELNLDGDQQADLAVHGGSCKAVYGYPSEHYAWWRRELPETSFSWGQFGENLTTEGLDETTLCVGDRLKAGSAVLMVTQPRAPCYKLQIRFERDDMIKRFLASERSGFYLSVVEQGEVCAGSEVEIVDRDPNRVTVAGVHRLYHGLSDDAELLERALRVSALPPKWRTKLRAGAAARG